MHGSLTQTPPSLNEIDPHTLAVLKEIHFNQLRHLVK